MDSHNNDQTAGSARDTAIIIAAVAVLIGGLAAFYTVAATQPAVVKAILILRRVSNPQPAVLETAALPVELLP